MMNEINQYTKKPPVHIGTNETVTVRFKIGYESSLLFHPGW